MPVVPTVAVAVALQGASPMERLGVVLAGVITCCWLVAGIAGMAAVARRAAKREPRTRPPRRRSRRSGGATGRGRLLLWAFGLTVLVLPLLLRGWSGWPWSAVNLALVGVGLGAVRLGERGSQRLVMLAVMVCLAGYGFVVYAVWGRLLLLGGIGTVFAVCLAVLVGVLLLSMFLVSVREAVTTTMAWCRRGGDGRWALVVGITAVTILLPVLAGLPLWAGPSAAMLLAASVGMFQLGAAEGGDGHVLSLVAGVVAGLYGALILASGVLSWERLF